MVPCAKSSSSITSTSQWFFSRKLLFRWSGWYFGCNVLVFWAIGFFYLKSALPLPPYILTAANEAMIGAFIALSFLGHLALLAYLPYIFLIVPCILLFPQRHFIIGLSILLATLSASLLIIDANVYSHYRFHLNGVITAMIFSGQADEIFALSWLEWVISAIIILGLLVLEVLLAVWVWRKIYTRQKNHPSPSLILSLIVGVLMLSYNIMGWGVSKDFQALTQQSLILPLYNNIITTLFPEENGLKIIETVGSARYVQPVQPARPLKYPLAPIVCQPKQHPLNILLIVIDTWRFDMVNPIVTPNLFAFANRSWNFTQHFSGGNSTQGGIFSLFYSLPGPYWTAMSKQHLQPVLFNELVKQNYRIGVFASAELTAPAFVDNVFYGLKNVHFNPPAPSPYARDKMVSQQFQQFIAAKTKPFFAFLFYDAAHSYCSEGNPINLFQPAVAVCNRITLNKKSNPIPYFNRYKNALYSVDMQIGEIIAQLQSHHLLDNTVVMITGDHGNEFNDNHQGYWEHTTNYSRYQVQTPLLVHWPKQGAAQLSHQTSHYDIAPTLLREVLGCQNPPQDYSIGFTLLDKRARPYLIASSYLDFGIIEKDRITEIFPSGNYTVYDEQYRPLIGAKPNLKTLTEAFNDMQKYYQRQP